MSENSGYFVVKKKALPEVLLKVVETQALLRTGKAATIQEAVDRTGISRSSFYKYKDDILYYISKYIKTILIVVGSITAIISAFLLFTFTSHK